MTTLTSALKVEAVEAFTKTVGLAEVSSPVQFRKSLTWQDGTTVNKADRLWQDSRTLAASTSEDLDLAGGLTDAFGAAITFARIKGLFIAAAITNTNNVVVGGASSNAFINWVGNANDVVNVRPGGILALIAPDVTAYAVTATTGDLLHIANSGAGSSVTYEIIIIGASA
jgi:hypothetical protein